MRQWTAEERKRQAEIIRKNKPWTKSTGPRTKAGKEKSKYNATKHGGRSAAFIRLRKALAAQSAYLKAVKDTAAAGFAVCSMIQSMGRGVTIELLRSTLNFCDPPPVMQAKILQFTGQTPQRDEPPPDMGAEKRAA